MEALSGISEKVIPLVRSPFVMRKLLPGGLAVGILYPYLGIHANVVSGPFESLYKPAILLAGLAVLLGVLVSLLCDQIYRVYEGRILWPQSVLDTLTNFQQKRVSSLLRKAVNAESTGRTLRHRELWYTLRRYPVNESGDPYASNPTLLGNVLAGYERYPLTRYGMDSVFYWTRIWLQLTSEKKEEINSVWCVSDGLVTLSAVAFTGAFWWGAIGVGHRAGLVPDRLARLSHPLFFAVFFLAAGYAFYRLSIPYARANGEIFKAVFDLYRVQISAISEIGPKETEKWRGIWSYLQYLKVHCGSCGRHYVARDEKCPTCGYSRAKSLERIASISKSSSSQPNFSGAQKE
jgi:ribosomal protein L37E